MDVDWFHRAWPPAEDDPENVLTEADNMAAVWKLERDTKAWLDALPEDGRARYGRALQAMAISISQHAAHGTAPDVVARAGCIR
jgi:hypothetical protein